MLLLGYVRLSETAVLVAIPFEEFYRAANLCFHPLMKAQIIQILELCFSPVLQILGFQVAIVFIGNYIIIGTLHSASSALFLRCTRAQHEVCSCMLAIVLLLFAEVGACNVSGSSHRPADWFCSPASCLTRWSRHSRQASTPATAPPAPRSTVKRSIAAMARVSTYARAHAPVCNAHACTRAHWHPHPPKGRLQHRVAV